MRILEVRSDFALTEDVPPTDDIPTDVVKLTSSQGIFFLDLDTGELFDVLGNKVFTYPGDWGDDDDDDDGDNDDGEGGEGG